MENRVRVLPLSPVDHVFTGPGSYAISCALAYDDSLDPERLQSSLEEALRVFWPLRSKLTTVSPHSYGFLPSDDGLIFETVRSTDPFAESRPMAFYVGPVQSVEGEPLTKIRLTHTPAGSVLGVSISHALADGFSFFHFLSSWARIAQGKRILSPSHDRESLLVDPLDQDEQATVEDLLVRCGLFSGRESADREPTLPPEESSSLSQRAIREMRAEAQGDTAVALFDNDVITAHAWKQYGARWALAGGDATVFVTIPFDFRRLLKSIPRTYFGCALAFATASLSHDRLTRASLGELSSLVRKSIAQVTSNYVQGSLGALETLRRRGGLAVVQDIEVRHPRQGLIVTNTSRLPILEIDFGSGPPTDFKLTAQAHRGVVILPADDGVVIRAFPPADTNQRC